MALSCTRGLSRHTIRIHGRADSSTPIGRPELRGNWPRAGSRLVSSLSSNIAAAAFVRVWRFIQPSKFGADFVDGGIGARHLTTMLCPVSIQLFASLCQKLFCVLNIAFEEFEFRMSHHSNRIGKFGYTLQVEIECVLVNYPEAFLFITRE